MNTLPIRHPREPRADLRHRNLQRPLLILCSVAALLVCSTATYAQEKTSSVQDDVIAGVVRVKVERGIIDQGLEPIFFGDAVERFGIVSVESWIKPELLDYIDRGSGLYRRNGAEAATETRAASLRRIVEVTYTAKFSPAVVARALAKIEGVEYAEPVPRHRLMYVPDDPRVDDNTQWHLERISALDAWDDVRGDSSVIIAITDTGIDEDHEDLAEAIWRNPGETGGGKETNGIDDDNNGFVDDWWGFDFGGDDGSSPDNDPSSDGNDHGTHVAGIAAAIGNNDRGGAGVAFGAQLMIVKISDGTVLDPELPGGFEGILYAASMGAKIINCSWGAKFGARSEQEVIDLVSINMGALVVAATGNDGVEQLRFPAGYDRVLSVSATTRSDGKWSGSNFGYGVDISSPGDRIYSTLLNDSYGLNSGTSMATPIVSAAAALLKKRNNSLQPEQLTQVLRATADKIDLAAGIQYRGKLGTGRLNMSEAIRNATGLVSAGLYNYQVNDESGDGVLDPGEEVTVVYTVKNFLNPSDGVETRVEVVEPLSLVVDNTFKDFGPMALGQEISTGTGPTIHFVVPESTLPNSRIVLRLTTETNENSSMEDYIVMDVFPTYATTDLNNIAATFNSVGNIGYNGLNRDQGVGFYYGINGSLLYHGGLMIGLGPTQVLDAVRKGPVAAGTEEDFLATESYRLEELEEGSLEIGSARFVDRLNQVGIDVQMTTFEFLDEPSFLMVRYRVTNTSPSTLDNLHCGLYLDWDLQSDGLGDQATFDLDNSMGIVRNPSTDIVLGTALVSGQDVDYYAMDNGVESVRTDFSDSEKWRMMSNGLSKTSTVAGIDVGMVIGGGPVSIPSKGSEEFVFAMLANNSIEGLKEAAGRAHELRSSLSAPDGNETVWTGLDVRVAPNPFSGTTGLRLDVRESQHLRLEIFNARGESIRLLYDGPINSGSRTFRFDPEELPSGLYFYEATAGNVRARGRLVLTR